MASTGRIDYSQFNYCRCCEERHPKSLDRCPHPWCNQKLRTRTHAPGAAARYRARQKRLLLEEQKQTILVKI